MNIKALFKSLLLRKFTTGLLILQLAITLGLLVNSTILAFDTKGNVCLCNKAFKELFKLDDFQNISELSCLEDEFPDFLVQLKTDKPNFRKYLIENSLLKLTVKAVEFRLENDSIKLISFQDIKNEITRAK